MSRLDTASGMMARQILLNVRIDPIVVLEVLPPSFKPILRHRYALGGISLMRFESLEANFLPIWLNSHSECAAFWFAVEWQQDGRTVTGAYVPRRESNSYLRRALGGRPFGGIFRRSHFESEESENCFRLRAKCLDDVHEIEFHGHIEQEMPENSVFSTVDEASDFFANGCLSYSPSEKEGFYDGIEFVTDGWNIEPIRIKSATSSFFDDRSLFPPGSLEVDSAFVMRDAVHEWRPHQSLTAPPDPTRLSNTTPFKGLTSSTS